MRYFVIVLALAINAVLVQSQEISFQARGSTDGANGGSTGDTGNSPPGAAGDGSVDCESTEDGYTYQIDASRTRNVIAPGHPVAYMTSKISSTQNLTYFTSVGPSNPLSIEGYIHNGNKVYFANDKDHLLDSCDNQPNGTWQFVLIEIVRKSVLLGGDCSVDKGSYTIDQDVDPITVTLPEMIKCGENKLIYNAYVPSSDEESNSKWTWAFQLHFNLGINGTCD